MWSSPLELYPVHIAPVQASSGQAHVMEPQVTYRVKEYLPIQPPTAPYEIQQEYTRRLWVC
jgi:hypothetical protein